MQPLVGKRGGRTPIATARIPATGIHCYASQGQRERRRIEHEKNVQYEGTNQDGESWSKRDLGAPRTSSGNNPRELALTRITPSKDGKRIRTEVKAKQVVGEWVSGKVVTSEPEQRAHTVIKISKGMGRTCPHTDRDGAGERTSTRTLANAKEPNTNKANRVEGVSGRTDTIDKRVRPGVSHVGPSRRKCRRPSCGPEERM